MLKVIEVALSEVGYHEGANNYNKYAAEMANWYGWSLQNQYWCDVFVDWCFIRAYGMDLASKLLYEPIGSASASCNVSMQHFQDAGRFSQDNPRIGDQVFFGPNGSSHTGLVISVNGNSFETVEGNTSDAVRRRNHSVGDGYTYGFGHPDYSILGNGMNSDTAADDTNQNGSEIADETLYATVCLLPELRRGDSGYYVRLLQVLLANKGYAPSNSILISGVYDGEFGAGTEDALNKYKATINLPTDSVCTPQVFAELINK